MTNSGDERSAVHQWALWYFEQGWSVVPVMPGEKRPGVEWANYQHERASREQIESWWSELYKDHGVGIITGAISGLVVIDVDDGEGKDGGDSLDILQLRHDDLPETRAVATGGGGKHLYFKHPGGDVRIKTGVNVLGPGIDVRGDGGFVVAPPTRHPCGKEYAWLNHEHLSDAEPAEMPAWLIELCLSDAPGSETQTNLTLTASPQPHTGAEFNAFGIRVDAREDYMTRLVWARVLEARRQCPIKPVSADEILADCWPVYERACKARESTLEAEGRGPTLMRQKIMRALKKWDGRVSEEAARPNPRKANDWGAYQAQFIEQDEDGKTIKCVDFYTLMTEEIEEDENYIETGFCAPGNFVVIAGPPKAQKSFLLQEMLVACATGNDFLDHKFTIPRPLRVFYLQAEMNRNLLRKRAREMTLLTPEQRDLLKTNLIATERFHMQLSIEGAKVAIDAIRAEFGETPPDIIAIDPLINVYDQEDENNNKQMLTFLTERLEVMRRVINPLAAMVLVHHTAKRNVDELRQDPFTAIRGAGALRSYYDSAIMMFRKAEGLKPRSVHFETRGGEEPPPMTVELDGGRFYEVAPNGDIGRETAKEILKALDAAWKAGEPWSPHARAEPEGRYGPALMAHEFGIDRRQAKQLLNQWAMNKIIIFRERTKHKHPAGFQRLQWLG